MSATIDRPIKAALAEVKSQLSGLSLATYHQPELSADPFALGYRRGGQFPPVVTR